MSGRVAIVWRGDRSRPAHESPYWERIRPLREALERRGMEPRAVLYEDTRDEDVREELIGAEGVLVWVDPIQGGEDRERLNETLLEVAAANRWVSAHPSTIDAIGTKRVLVDCQDMSWGVESRLYTDSGALREGLEQGLATSSRVLKPLRGNGGLGVWKVAPVVDAAGEWSGASTVLVQDAARRDDVLEEMSLDEFLPTFDAAFAGAGAVVDQRFVDGLRRGMVRAYLSADAVVGFAVQLPAIEAPTPIDPSRDPVFAMAASKEMHEPGTDRFAALRDSIEGSWVPELCRRFGLEHRDLPVIWDLDFLRSPEPPAGDGRYVLCEINVSCVVPYPPFAVDAIAATAAERFA